MRSVTILLMMSCRARMGAARSFGGYWRTAETQVKPLGSSTPAAAAFSVIRLTAARRSS